MTKKEIVWREVLNQAIASKKFTFTQKELASKYGFSLSTVFNALRTPRASGIIEVFGRGFRLQDVEKFLYLWATFRQLKKEIIYKTHVEKGVREIEGEMPPEVIFGAFQAFIQKYKEAPADYDKVYVYLKTQDLFKIKSRFPPKKGRPNIIVLEADPWLEKFGKTTPDVQTFVDLWNLSEWYARDFLDALKEKFFK